MKNFHKLILGILAIICCSNNNVIASSDPANNPAIDDSINAIGVNEAIDLAVSHIRSVQTDLDAHDRVNTLMKSFRNHQVNNNTLFNTFILGVYNNYTQMGKINNINMLFMNNINLQNLNQSTLNITIELCNNNFKNVLEQNDMNKISNIMTYFNTKAFNKKYEMLEHLHIIKNMSQDKKDILREYLLSNLFKDIIKLIDESIYYVTYNYDKLNNINFIDQNITHIKQNAIEMTKNVLDFLKAEKECLQELDIDIATVG